MNEGPIVQKRLQLVEVFGDENFKGSNVPVAISPENLAKEQMREIGRSLGLPNLVFLLPPTILDADYRVRTFRHDRELPFAGDTTLAACHAWLEAGGKPKGQDIVQQCMAGLVGIRRVGKGYAFALSPFAEPSPVSETEIGQAAELLGIDRSVVVDARRFKRGRGWLGLLLESADAVLALRPGNSHSERVSFGIVGRHPSDSMVDWELRAIFSDRNGTLVEDPIAGALSTSAAQWLIASGRAGRRFVAAQGTGSGRVERIVVVQDEADISWIAGTAKTLPSGQTE